ncbi:hypothetical protein INR49_005241 [Caranx melampygus]|nr:hypothetical protein INR49_005241 [Caranx melampygus]
MDESREVRTDGNSLLKAVSLSRLRLTRLLLDGGAYINESNEHGETPLMVACKTCHTDSQSVPKHKIIRYLLENGADPNIQDKTGKTALMHACLEQAGAEILSLLLSSGADPTLEDHAGLSALIYAVNSGNRDILQALLDACKAKGKEVIIITTNKLPSGHQVTKQYFNVPPPSDLEEHLHYTPTSAYELQLQTLPQGSSASASPQPGSPFLCLRDSHCFGSGPSLITSQPGSPIQHSSPLHANGMDKQNNFHRPHSDQWSKGPSFLLQQSQNSSLTEEPVEITPEEDLPSRINSNISHNRSVAVSCNHGMDIQDTTGFLKSIENVSGNDNKGGLGRGFGRKMSYDSAASSLHFASHPNLHRYSLPFPHESSPVDEDSSDGFTQLNVSSLENVVHCQSIGINHYSSDSQLPQFGSSRNNSSKSSGGTGMGTERHKLINSRSSTLSGSREFLESPFQNRGTALLDRRGSGALLVDHIAHTRRGYLPPLNPHAPIPDIGVNSSSSHPSRVSSKTLNGVPTGSKTFVPCAPVFPRNIQVKKMLWRRHSMQSEQMKQLGNFEGTFGH